MALPALNTCLLISIMARDVSFFVPQRPYMNKLYLPYQWRRWKDFGGGTLSDMGYHLMDVAFTALEISTVTSVRSIGPKRCSWGVLASDFKGEKLLWDSKTMSFLNSAEATTLIRRKYAPRFEIKGL